MFYSTRLRWRNKLELLLLRYCSNKSAEVSFPEIKTLLSNETRDSCVKRFQAIKISPRRKPSETTKKAAVLIPLCVVDGEVALLYTLRRADLKRHRGQVSFPGGIQDSTDTSLEDTALRETEEELGVDRSKVALWGSGSIVTGTEFSVLPVLGSLGQIDVDTLNPNPDEVEAVFTVTLKHFCDLKNCRYTQFRMGPDKGYVLPAYTNSQFRVWGITALMTHIVLSSILPQHYKHKLKYIKPMVLSSPVL